MTAAGLDLVTVAGDGKSARADFLIARRVVTVGEFRRLVRGEGPGPADLTMLASEGEALHYCNLLSAEAGLPPAYDETTGALIDADGARTPDVAVVRGFRLPTGSEWDYAARGGQPDSPYANWGAVLDRIYWDDPTSHYANPVSPKEPVTNVIGLVGMLGFVREWCTLFSRSGDSSNLPCGWGHYYTNYDCFIAYHVTRDAPAAGATYPFRVALTAA